MSETMLRKTGHRGREKSLVTNKLENVSKAVFKRYYPLITELVGSSPGIYALYDGNSLYYVGKSTDLRKRVRHHLRDRHYASWTHFSLYLVRKSDHIDEIESLLIRISNPKGNRVTPKGKADSTMQKKLKLMIKQKQKEEFEEMFGDGKRGKRKSVVQKKYPKRKIKGLVSKRTSLYRTYKGQEYKAILTPDGIIEMNDKKFASPTAAAMSIVDKGAVSGWSFWYIEDLNGDWVRLSDFKG